MQNKRAISSNKTPITSVNQLKGKRIAVTTGTMQDAYFSKNEPDVKLPETTADQIVVEGGKTN